jgi:hypothetical protein
LEGLLSLREREQLADLLIFQKREGERERERDPVDVVNMVEFISQINFNGVELLQKETCCNKFYYLYYTWFLFIKRVSGVIGKWTAFCPKRRGTKGSSTDVSGPKHGYGHDEEKSFHDYTSGNVNSLVYILTLVNYKISLMSLYNLLCHAYRTNMFNMLMLVIYHEKGFMFLILFVVPLL